MEHNGRARLMQLIFQYVLAHNGESPDRNENWEYLEDNSGYLVPETTIFAWYLCISYYQTSQGLAMAF